MCRNCFIRTECVLSHYSHVQIAVTPWTLAPQAPLSMGFSRQEYWSGLSFTPMGVLPDPGMKFASTELQADSLLTEPSRKPSFIVHIQIKTDYPHY